MTEERKKYLASISKEERAIRASLEIEHYELKANKELVNAYKDSKEYYKQYKEGIARAKTTIKALKKQLPAPKKMIWSCFEECVCPICEEGVQQEYDNYCPNCGQKLR